MTAPSTTSEEPKLQSSTTEHSSSSSSGTKVRVVARIRPLAKYEIDSGSKPVVSSLLSGGKKTKFTAGGTLPPLPTDPEVVQVVSEDGSANISADKRWFELDAVLDGNSTQAEVYWKTGAQQAVSQDLFQGYNCTILAYGQTGAGKTFTMGTASKAAIVDDAADSNPEIGEMEGVIPRVCRDLFKGIQEYCDGNATVELSYLEIYNEEIRDLLVADSNGKKGGAAAPQELRIRETLTGEVYVSGLSSRPVTSPADIGRNMAEAGKKRVVASTKMNSESSRSHALCILTVRGVLEDATKITSKLTLVDLAGSERMKKTGAQGSRRQEGININKGLFVLGQVVSALSEQRPKYQRKPPYRDSKLTRLLQDSLGGNSKTIMIACCSPANCNVEETLNTLRYATSARNIQTTATKNVIQIISPEEAAKLRRDNELLQQQVKELQATVQKMTVTMDDDSSSGSGGEDFTIGGEGNASGTKEDEATRRIRELEQDVEELRFAALQGGDAMAALAATPAKSSYSSSSPGSPPLSPVRTSGRPNHHNHPGSMSSSKLSLKKAGSLRSLSAANQAAHAMIELPALKLQLAHLQEENQIIPELQLEIEILREEMEELQVDATSSRQAASQLSRILDQLREYKDSEVEKKKLEYDHLKIEEAWVNFVCQMMESNREQIQKLRDDFYLVVRVVEQQQQLENQLRELKEVGGDSGSGSGGTSHKKKTPTSKETAAAKTAVNKLAISQAQKLASQASQNIGRWWKNRRGTAEEEEQQQRARQVSQALTNPAGGGPVVKDVNSAWGAGTGGERPTITVDTTGSGSETVQVALDEVMDDPDEDVTNENDDDEEDDSDDDDSVNPARKLQQELLEQHIQFFDDKMEEMEQDMTAESETLESMRESLRQQREGLEEEIGVDELQRDSLDHVVEMQRDNELLEQLTALLIGGSGSGGAAAVIAKKMAEKLQEQEQQQPPMINDDKTEKLKEAVSDDGLVPIVEDEEDEVGDEGQEDEREEKEQEHDHDQEEGIENGNKDLGDDKEN